jgi:division protein CdvB (Snf7/Vps24/ESCRT-III family)
MPSRIVKNWDSEGRVPQATLSRLSGHIRPPMPLKERIAQSIYRLKVQQNKLENSAMKMQRHDRNLFDKCITAQMTKDASRAALYASECAEIRKMASTVLRCQLAMEKVILRLENVQLFGDTVSMMGPVADVVRSIGSQISGIMPEVSFALGDIGETLNSVVIEVGEATGQTYDDFAASSEAQKILTEASTVAEQRMTEKFPDLPRVAAATGARYSESGVTQ